MKVQTNANFNFIMLSDSEKARIGKLLTDYKHNASKWHYTKREEVERELRHYGLIEF